MKKLFVLILFIGLPIIIYLMTINNKIYYVALGDSLAVGQNPYGQISYGYADYIADNFSNRNLLDFYTKKFAASGYRTTDLINDINDNKEIMVDGKKITIKHALTKADIVTLSIGMNDLFYKLGAKNADIIYNETDLKKYANQIISDTEKLIVLIKKYCKEDIIVIGYYNPLLQMKTASSKLADSIILYANKNLKELTVKYKTYYVDIYSLFANNSDYLPNPLDINPSSEGYSAISQKIISVIKKKS